MSQSYDIEIFEESNDFPVSEMAWGELCIVTHVTVDHWHDGAIVGEPIVRVRNEWSLLLSRQCTTIPEGLRARRLRPGETVAFKGK